MDTDLIVDSSESEHSDAFDAQEDDERDVLRPARQALGLSRKYVPDWKQIHAIRELYQKW